MSLSERQPKLRLVRADSPDSMASWHASNAVARENAAAARNSELKPNDPRWVLAVQTAAQLDGDRLSPEARKRIERTARLLGVRTFDANVIMAIVQDHARQKLPLSSSSGMIEMVQPVQRQRDNTLTRWALALGLAGLVVFALIQWITAT